MSVSRASNNICLFDIAANRFLGKVASRKHEGGFFDRDVGFSRVRRVAFLTDPTDETISAIDVDSPHTIGQATLATKPDWTKVLTV